MTQPRAQKVRCPVCPAKVGEPCRAKGDPLPLLESHPERRRRAEDRHNWIQDGYYSHDRDSGGRGPR